MEIIGLVDPFRKLHASETIPLTVSHKANKKLERRYDYIFVNQAKFDIIDINYYYDKAILAGSDHALVVCEVNKIPKIQIINYCERAKNLMIFTLQTLLNDFVSK